MPTYRERVHWPGWCHLLFLLPYCFGLFGLTALLIQEGFRPLAMLPFLVLMSVAVLWWRLRFLHVEVGPEGVVFGFGGPRRRVPRERVVALVPEEYSVLRYMGWGYRFGWQPRERACSLIGCRRGVRLTFDDERGRRWRVFLSCSDPEAAVAALEA